MKHLFLSFSQRDKNYMLAMRENLVAVGYKPWVDPNPRPNLDWRFAIDDAIRAADAVIVIMTPSAAESTYVTYEWSLALGYGKPVIPVIFNKTKMHPRLQTLEHFDVNSFTEKTHFWEYFLREIGRLIPDNAVPNLPNVASVPSPQPQPQVAPQAAYTRQFMPSSRGHYLVMRRGPRLNHLYALNKQLLTLGRDEANDIQIDDGEVSRYHLRVHWNGTGYSVEDLQSTNGTRLNSGALINTVTPLKAGDALMLGDTIILSYEVVE